MFNKIAILIIFLSLTGCKAKSFYIADYQEAQQQIAGSAVDVKTVKDLFAHVYLDMKQGDLAGRVKETYAEPLYFNDTLHTYKNVPDLARYLQKTADRLAKFEAQIDDVAVNGNEAYVRWTMAFQVNKNSQPMISVGVTHLRFNEQGKIILHQDYWDGVEGLYRSVPVLGSMLKGVRKRL